MKTFTTCAEKKAKQFFNLLQGYTKGIRITAILILLLMGVGNAWGATTATLYYSVPASTVGCYSVKCYYNFGYSQTGLVEMTKVDKTSSGNLIYSVNLTANHDNVDNLLFQLFDGNTWKSEQQVMKDWTPLANNSGKMYVHNTGWKAYSTDAAYTVYFVNKDSWTGTIKAYAWNSDCDKNKDWSGADMTSTGKTYQGKNIYSITLNKRYANIIFNNGSSQTGDLTLGSTNIGKMYDGSNWVDYNVDPVVTFKANGGTGSDYTQTVKYNTSTALTENTFTRTGYTFAGWNTKTDGTGTSYTDKQKVTLKANTTLYAKWTEKTYAVTISAGSGGTVSPSGSKTIGQVTKTTVTATPNANYEFVNWTATGGVVVANTTSASTTITATATGTLTANFRSTATHALTVVAGNGISQVAGSTDPVTLGSTYHIEATPKTGYTFSTWTAEPEENATFGNATTANTTVTVKNGSVTVTASATENMSTLTTSNSYTEGNPEYAAPTASVNSIGYETTATVTATTPSGAYTFTGWTLTNCERTNNGEATALTITVRSMGDGAAATVIANYEKIPSKTVYFKPKTDWKNNNPVIICDEASTAVTPYDCAGEYYTAEVPGGTTNLKFGCDNEQTLPLTVPADEKVLYDMTSKNITKLYLKANSAWEKDGARFAAYFFGNGDKWVSMTVVAGQTNLYEVAIPTDKSYPSVIFCRMNGGNQTNNWGNRWNQTEDLTIPTDGTNTAQLPSSITTGVTWHTTWDDSRWKEFTAPTYNITLDQTTGGTITVSKRSGITLNEQVTVTMAASTGYTFKSGTITIGTQDAQTFTETETTHIICGDATITAEWTANQYDVTLDQQGGIDGTTSVKATYDAAMPKITPPTRTGYTFGGYYTETNGGGTQYYNANGGSAKNWDIASATTLYAKWTANKYTITWNANGGTVAPTTSTYIYDGAPVDMPNPERTGCTFNGWFTESTGGERVSDVGKDNKPTSNVTYYAQWTIPAPTTDHTAVRVYKEQTINGWISGDGAQATPYQFYNDETVRLTVTPLTEVAGLTAYYKVGETEQTANTFDLTTITTEVTPITITTYYKDSYGNKETEATTTVYFQQVLTPQLLLVTDPVKEISLEKVQAGTNVELTYSATYNGYTGSVTIKENESILATTSETKVVINRTPTDIGILTFTATTEVVAGRVFETSTEVAVYKLVTIKVNDPQGLMNKVYLWRDATDAEDANIKTEWPGESFLQNFGTWHIFTVKYPYYTRFIVNDSKDFVQENGKQTENYDIPDHDACYELSDGRNGSGKYELAGANCPGDLAVSDIANITITQGEQKVVAPTVQVSLGNKLSDVTATVSSANTTTATAIMSGTNIIVYGHKVGSTTITVNYTLHGETVTKTFLVTVEKDTHITIQVKVPIGGSGTPYDNIGWNDNSNIKIHYWWSNGTNHDITLEYVYEETNKYKYLQAELPLHTDGKTNFLVYYEYLNEEVWRKSPDVTNVSTDGCYTMKNAGYGNQPSISRSGDYCWEEADEYQVKIVMQNGKEYSSNIVTSTSDILSFFAPGKDEVNYRSGVVMLYKNGNLHTTIAPATFSESNVYTAQINDDGTGLTNVAVYTGNYYVRTYGNNDWGQRYYQEWTDDQRSQRKFTYFVPREGEFYNHYWIETLEYYDAGKDVSGWVANRYNNDLAGKLQNDKITDNNGKIYFDNEQTANIRFGYDPRTNYFGRAILKGSGENRDFLNVHCDNAFSDAACQTALPYGTSENANKFTDMSNWVYQSEFYVEINGTQPNAKLYIDATAYRVDGKTPKDHLLGYEIDENDGSETDIPKQRTIMGSGTTNGIYHMVVIYDFKTNRLITAWKPEATNDVSTPTTVKSDVIFIRHENDDAPQINLSGQGRINELQTLYFALELERGDANANNRHEEQYWFTLPFDCVVGEISGVPGYMETWGIQRYRGDLRAQKGWFLETPTFWEWLSPTDILKAGEGYLLAFDKKAASWAEYEDLDAGGVIRSILRLYFPSLKDTFNLQQATQEELTVTYPDHTCTITYKERYKQDSNWKVIGTTSYNNATIQGIVKDTDPGYETWDGNDVPKFRYKYSYTFDNNNNRTSYSYEPEDGQTATYKSFFSYMVQFAGTITWNPINKSVNPEGLAARRYVPEGERTSFTTRLELTNATGEKQDQTFVALDENGTTGFDQNKDLNKVINSGANIYTLAENISYAGNTLAMEKQNVPVGVVIAESGEYTFRMPDGTDGISVFLIDNQTGTQTNMLLDEYTITLDAGTCENRFYLAVDPDRTATSVENIGEEAKGDEAKDQIKKFLIDGQLFIRTADGTFDAKGQRL